MRVGTGLRLAALGGRADGLRVGLTTLGSAGATVALLAGATVAAIAPGDGPYTSALLNEGGLHPGVIAASWLLCVPVLVFVGQCSRVGAPARDRRLASLRMAGASPRQVVGVAAAESSLAAGVGAVLGLGVYLVGRQLLDRSVTGSFTVQRPLGETGIVIDTIDRALPLPTDVLPAWWVLLLVVLLVPLLATAGSALALRRTAITPFGVLRGQRTRPPRLLPVALLVVGVGGTFFLGFLLSAHVAGAVTLLAVVALLLCTVSGLLLGTAAATRATGLFLASRVRSPALLIAARRMVARPFAASRAGAAVLIAVLVAAGARMVRANFLTLSDVNVDFSAFQLVDLALGVALVVAAAGLLVAAAEGLVERRRTLAALVAAGTPRGVLARAALAEAVLPLVLPVLVAAAAGTTVTYAIYGRTQTGYDEAAQQLVTEAVPVPWVGVGLVVVAALVAITAVTALALLFLRQATDLGELRAAA